MNFGIFSHFVWRVKLCATRGLEMRSLDCWRSYSSVCFGRRCYENDPLTDHEFHDDGEVSGAAESTMGSERWGELGFPSTPSWSTSHSSDKLLWMFCALVIHVFCKTLLLYVSIVPFTSQRHTLNVFPLWRCVSVESLIHFLNDLLRVSLTWFSSQSWQCQTVSHWFLITTATLFTTFNGAIKHKK